MRIKILADVRDGITLPINYNYQLAGVIYRFLAESDPEYASFLYYTLILFSHSFFIERQHIASWRHTAHLRR